LRPGARRPACRARRYPNEGGAAPLASVPLLDGWSARAAGVATRFGNGASLAVGAELGGLGSNVQILTFPGRASVPF
jgi:hypothetical protein